LARPAGRPPEPGRQPQASSDVLRLPQQDRYRVKPRPAASGPAPAAWPRRTRCCERSTAAAAGHREGICLPLVVDGVLQNQGGAVSVKADRIEAFGHDGPRAESHDFH